MVATIQSQPQLVGWAKRSVPTAFTAFLAQKKTAWARRCAPLPTLRLTPKFNRFTGAQAQKCSWIATSSPLLAKCDEGNCAWRPRAARWFRPIRSIHLRCVERMARVNNSGLSDLAPRRQPTPVRPALLVDRSFFGGSIKQPRLMPRAMRSRNGMRPRRDFGRTKLGQKRQRFQCCARRAGA